jgi:hypothetical protein
MIDTGNYILIIDSTKLCFVVLIVNLFFFFLFTKTKGVNMNKRFIIINEQHSLLPDQERALNEHWSNSYKTETVLVPAEGWTYKQQIEIADQLVEKVSEKTFKHTPWPEVVVIFVSPVPALMLLLTRLHGEINIVTLTFHNDNRVAKEITDKNGNKKLIHTVAPTGWQLV